MSLQWFLALDGVVGESTVKGYEGQIEVDFVSWGAGAELPAVHGGGAGAGRVHVEPLTIMARAGRASPALFLLTVQGNHVRSAVLSGVAVGERRDRLVEIALEEVTLSAWHLTDSERGMSEAITMAGRRLRYSVWTPQPDGSLGDPQVAQWDQQVRAWSPPALPSQD